MLKENKKTLSLLVLIIAVFYIIHKSAFSILKFNTEDFQYSLEKIYVFFAVFSIVIILVLIKVKQKNLDIVGNVYLLATLIKMMFCFFIGRTILLKSVSLNDSTEKWNFVTLFMLFLFLETLITIRLLNEKKPT